MFALCSFPVKYRYAYENVIVIILQEITYIFRVLYTIFMTTTYHRVLKETSLLEKKITLEISTEMLEISEMHIRIIFYWQ